MSLFKLCRCGKPIPMQDRACPLCLEKKKQRHKLYDETRRDKRAEAFYKSKAWKRIRQQVLIRDHYLCQECLKNQRITKAEIVDHIIPLTIDWSLSLSLNNLQSLCQSCHNRKTAEDKKKYKGVGGI